jgi:magnesium chelatase family protein
VLVHLSARGHHRALRVARTVADLNGAKGIERTHVLETCPCVSTGRREALAA